ncbi:hypothetical protein Rxycam_00259 [Rubrobacter xylanophilus DSM 9941]|uniref:hypothetical protein n=1 Tax=Rubrobacter xylanophilus TaxID=49319 RepID=UPI001C64274C|nr:hypothetical protein [Rubrobacter xylanophilus]QYJ14463.1 hypothetical protein Rxycam_00259 [Rubrobacter xylanophilus DSM 9941]
MKSLGAVVLGVLLSLLLGLLLVFGIFAPVLTAVFGLQGGVDTLGATGLPTVLVAFSAAFGFYFGGMAAGYYAPARRRLHGVAVPAVAFAISPVLNLLSGDGAFPGVGTAWAALVVVAVLVLSFVASYVGARRGEALYHYHEKLRRRR